MERRKIVNGDVYLRERMHMIGRDGALGGLKYVSGEKILAVEIDGQAYVAVQWRRGYSPEGILLPIRDKFDDLEGEEIKAGGNASEKKE